MSKEHENYLSKKVFFVLNEKSVEVNHVKIEIVRAISSQFNYTVVIIRT